ncbi:MAG: hypothetical protein ACREUL_11560 [Steroidobacteraceae bacterium]
MSATRNIARLSCLLSLIALFGGCVLVPAHGYHEGYYDAPHHRYWHNHAWVQCRDRDRHCH